MVNQIMKLGWFLTIKSTGWLCVCTKKPRPTRPEDLSHLKFLNADLKFLTPNLAKRLSPWLYSLLHPCQHYWINGRSLYEAITTVREAIAWAEYTRTSMCILLLHFRDAFDNISYAYLFKILEIYGSSNRFQRCIWNMYRNATSSEHVNGYRSGKSPVECSVRQGCPQNMQLFATSYYVP